MKRILFLGGGGEKGRNPFPARQRVREYPQIWRRDGVCGSRYARGARLLGAADRALSLSLSLLMIMRELVGAEGRSTVRNHG